MKTDPNRPKLLVLMCAAGGGSTGYHRAGLQPYGVDIDPQPAYPFPFAQDDALGYLDYLLWLKSQHGKLPKPFNFDAVHASPPCQHDSEITRVSGDPSSHPDLIGPVQERLRALGLPYIIENVRGARHKLRDPLMLCGTMDEFPDLRVIRHRYFEISGFTVPQPEHRGPHPLCFTMDKRKPHYGKLDEMVNYVQVTGGGNCSVAAAKDAMGMDWPGLTKHDLNEAVPPAMTEYIGRHLVAHLEGAA